MTIRCNVANGVDERLLDAVAAGLREVPVTPRGGRGSERSPALVARTASRWSPRRAISLLAWPGQEPRAGRVHRLRTGMRAGAQRATLSASIGHERVIVPVRVAATLRGPSMQLAPAAVLS